MGDDRSAKEDIDFKYNLKIYFGFLKRYKLLFGALVSLIIIYELLKLGVNLLFKQLVDKGTLFAAGAMEREAFSALISSLAITYLVIVLFRTIGKWFHLHWLNKLDSSLMVDLKRHFYNHLVSLSHKFHTTHKSGSMISRIIRGSGGIERMTDFLAFNLFPVFVQVIIAGAALAYFDLTSSFILFGTAILFVSYSLYVQQRQRPATNEANHAEDIEKAMIADTFTNIDSIKYYGKEELVGERYRALSETSREKQLRNWNYYRWLDAGQIAILSLGVIATLYFPLQAFLAGTISLGTLTFIYSTYGLVLDSLFGFMHGVRNFYRSMMDFNDLFQYNKIENDITDAEDAVPLVISKGTIEFKNVGFKYHDRWLFRNFSLSIPANTKVALVGPSGSGKSTLVKLLYRLYDVDEGRILIDGKDIRGFTQESLRSELSIVPQECVLFDDTVFNNIKFSRPDAKKEEVMQAIAFAQLAKTVKTFPKKEETIVGERGVKLSGGEKQRVSIARALLANKKVLVLDEATSSLDSQTEHEIQGDLQRLMKGRTSLIIAHRLSTIMHADIIIVLDKGKIVQQGTHAQLIRKRGLYRKLWDLQKGGYLTNENDDEA